MTQSWTYLVSLNPVTGLHYSAPTFQNRLPDSPIYSPAQLKLLQATLLLFNFVSDEFVPFSFDSLHYRSVTTSELFLNKRISISMFHPVIESLSLSILYATFYNIPSSSYVVVQHTVSVHHLMIFTLLRHLSSVLSTLSHSSHISTYSYVSFS